MLEQLATRLQRHTGRTRESSWWLIIQYGIKGRLDYRRWTNSELEAVREGLVKRSIDDVAKELRRTPKAVRNMLRRNHPSLGEICCDQFSVESLAITLHVRKAEVVLWIERGWLEATLESHGKRRFYLIAPEVLKDLYKHHHRDSMEHEERSMPF